MPKQADRLFDTRSWAVDVASGLDASTAAELPSGTDGEPVPEPRNVVRVGDRLFVRAVAFFPYVPDPHIPPDASPVIGKALLAWWAQETMTPQGRAELAQIVPLLAGTRAGIALERRRAWAVVDHLRATSVEWLEAGRLNDEAEDVKRWGPLGPASAKRATAYTRSLADKLAQTRNSRSGSVPWAAALPRLDRAGWRAVTAGIVDAEDDATWRAQFEWREVQENAIRLALSRLPASSFAIACDVHRMHAQLLLRDLAALERRDLFGILKR